VPSKDAGQEKTPKANCDGGAASLQERAAVKYDGDKSTPKILIVINPGQSLMQTESEKKRKKMKQELLSRAGGAPASVTHLADSQEEQNNFK